MTPSSVTDAAERTAAETVLKGRGRFDVYITGGEGWVKFRLTGPGATAPPDVRSWEWYTHGWVIGVRAYTVTSEDGRARARKWQLKDDGLEEICDSP